MSDLQPTSSERWYASLCYLSVIVLAPMILVKRKTEFLARHCRQGFALCCAEIVALIVLTIFDATLGHIPLLGLILSIILHLLVFLTALALSVLGFVRALSGESWTIPFLDDIADRVPVQAEQP